MPADPYTRLASAAVYKNRWLTVERHEILHPNGNPGEHVLIRGGAPSGIVVLDGDDVLFVAQPRFAARREMVEIVKGARDDGETALAAAKREVEEELGVRAASWQSLGSAWELPSLMPEPVELFLAYDLSPGNFAPEDSEVLRTVRMTFSAALDQALSGGIDDAVTITALLRAAKRLNTFGA
jgi:ADP-ribose pyrophosphatase